MALTIVRNDIVRMRVDAIVNSTNERLIPGGLGVDAGIHAAAGPELAEALREIDCCPVGSAVITDAFRIPGCRYIIHTVGPVYQDGLHGEERLLRSCYRSVLQLARSHACRSVAIPLLCTGAYGYPKSEGYRIATSVVRDFLFSLPEDEDMMVYLVLFDRESVAVGEKIDADVEESISDEYREEKKRFLLASRRENAARADMCFDAAPSYAAPPCAAREELPCAASRPAPKAARQIPGLAGMAESVIGAAGAGKRKRDYAAQDLSFAQMCEWWCEQKGVSKKEFYICANINKSMFWNMKHHPEQIPKKTNVLACAIGLKLDYGETQDLLMRAGMTLSKYCALDAVVEGFIRRSNYDIYEINEALFDRDLPLLGAC